jgi:hypothetical protein
MFNPNDISKPLIEDSFMKAAKQNSTEEYNNLYRAMFCKIIKRDDIMQILHFISVLNIAYNVYQPNIKDFQNIVNNTINDITDTVHGYYFVNSYDPDKDKRKQIKFIVEQTVKIFHNISDIKDLKNIYEKLNTYISNQDFSCSKELLQFLKEEYNH